MKKKKDGVNHPHLNPYGFEERACFVRDKSNWLIRGQKR
jgi:hypothetical protein